MAKFGSMLRGIQTTVEIARMAKSLMPKSADAPQHLGGHFDEIERDSGMADLPALEQYRLKPDSYYLGRVHPDHGANFPCGSNDDRHIFIVAGNAAGKGRSLAVQNLIRWQGGTFSIDPKGEFAGITAMRRGKGEKAKGTATSVKNFLGQDVGILDPFNVTKGAARVHKVRYDPLRDIDMSRSGGVDHIQKLARAIIVPEEGNAAHFSENAQTLWAGTVEAVKLLEKQQDHTLAFVRKKMLAGLEELYTYLTDDRLPKENLAAEAVGVLNELLGSEEAGSFKSTLSRNLKWMASPDMRDHLQDSDFSLWDMVQRGGSVYVVIPPDMIDDYKSWLRLMVQMAMSAKIALGTEQTTIPTLFTIDEFSLLGRFGEVERQASYARGFNVKMALIIQNIGQVKNLYKGNWETFLGNAGAIVAFGTNDLETEKYISDRMGQVMTIETTFSNNTGETMQTLSSSGTSVGSSTSQARHMRPVKMPNEIHEQAARETMRAFIVPASGKPFAIQRQNYDAIKETGLFDSPQHIAEWERRFAGRVGK